MAFETGRCVRKALRDANNRLLCDPLPDTILDDMESSVSQHAHRLRCFAMLYPHRVRCQQKIRVDAWWRNQ